MAGLVQRPEWGQSALFLWARHSPPRSHHAMASRKVGNRIRERRKALGLSEEKLGAMLGYTHRTISMLELGQLPDPRVSVALKLAKALQCKVEDIFQSN